MSSSWSNTRSNNWEVGKMSKCDKCDKRVRCCSQHRLTNLECISSDGNSCLRIQQCLLTNNKIAEDHYIVLHVKRDRWQTVGEIARSMDHASGQRISRFTVARRQHKGGMYVRWGMMISTVCTINAGEAGFCGVRNTRNGHNRNRLEYSLRIRADIVCGAVIDKYTPGETKEHVIIPPTSSKRTVLEVPVF